MASGSKSKRWSDIADEEEASEEASSLARSYSDVVRDGSPSPPPVETARVALVVDQVAASSTRPQGVRRMASLVFRQEPVRRPSVGAGQPSGRNQKRQQRGGGPLPLLTVSAGVPQDLAGLCFNCAEPGHVAGMCTNKTKCLACGGEEHVAGECTTAVGRTGHPPPPRTRSPVEPPVASSRGAPPSLPVQRSTPVRERIGV
jgi:hypothetical protein